MSVRQENKVDKVIILRWLEYRTFLLVKITDITATFLFCHIKIFWRLNPAGIYLFKVKNQNNVWNHFKVNKKDTRTTSMATFFVVIVNFGVFIVNFEQISYMALVFPWLTLNKQLPEGHYISSLRHYLHVLKIKVNAFLDGRCCGYTLTPSRHLPT